MEKKAFALIYEGPLLASGKNRRIDNKHAIRKELHPQIADLINLPEWEPYTKDKYQSQIAKNLKSIDFIPIVNTHFEQVASLNITLFRPERPGRIITESGDLDNRLKTLFDALRIPENTGEMPSSEDASNNPNPFFCLLESDSLITEFSIVTHQRFAVNETMNASEVILFVEVDVDSGVIF